jgi:fluoride ion exporter CrcB/FEX
MLDDLVATLGGALGTGARFRVAEVVTGAFGEAFRFGAPAPNLTASFPAGVVATPFRGASRPNAPKA